MTFEVRKKLDGIKTKIRKPIKVTTVTQQRVEKQNLKKCTAGIRK